MSNPQHSPAATCVDTLQHKLESLTVQRYTEHVGAPHDARESAAAAGDTEYLLTCLELAETRARAEALDWPWLAPAHRPVPRDALRRIQAVCRQIPDLYCALLTLAATHATLDRSMLAQAARKFRPDLNAHNEEDIAGMITAAWTGGKEGFDAVMRTRRKRSAPEVGFAWTTSE